MIQSMSNSLLSNRPKPNGTISDSNALSSLGYLLVYSGNLLFLWAIRVGILSYRPTPVQEFENCIRFCAILSWVQENLSNRCPGGKKVLTFAASDPEATGIGKEPPDLGSSCTVILPVPGNFGPFSIPWRNLHIIEHFGVLWRKRSLDPKRKGQSVGRGMKLPFKCGGMLS